MDPCVTDGCTKIMTNSKIMHILKNVTIIDPVTGWFVIVQYNDKQSATI